MRYQINLASQAWNMSVNDHTVFRYVIEGLHCGWVLRNYHWTMRPCVAAQDKQSIKRMQWHCEEKSRAYAELPRGLQYEIVYLMFRQVCIERCICYIIDIMQTDKCQECLEGEAVQLHWLQCCISIWAWQTVTRTDSIISNVLELLLVTFHQLNVFGDLATRAADVFGSKGGSNKSHVSNFL